jgi:hypothetical protein
VVPFLLTSAAAAQRIKPLTAQDYFEIQQLYAAYCWGLDTGDGAARGAIFTPDGRFLSSLSGHKGDSAQAIAQRTTSGGPSPYRHGRSGEGSQRLPRYPLSKPWPGGVQ